MVGSVSEFNGIALGRPDIARLIDEGVLHIVSLRRGVREDRTLRFALNASIGSVNALLSAASSKCTIDAPPADIDMVPNGSGDLIYQCHHNPIHRWDLNGHRV